MKITKIKHKDGKTAITWTVVNGDDREERHLPSKDEPLEEFTDALEALKGDALHALELPPDYGEKVELTTVSLDEDKHGNLGVVFSLRVKVGCGTFSISVPRLREPGEDGEGDGETMLVPAQLERLDDLCTAATRYVGGDRQQGDLFAGQDEENEAEETTEATT